MGFVRRSSLVAVAILLGSVPLASQEPPTPAVFVIAAGNDAVTVTEADGSTAEFFEKAPGDSALRWKTPGGDALAMVSIAHVPPDVREYRILRLKLRAAAGGDQQIHVCLSGEEGMLQGLLPAPGPEWKTVELLLPDMFSRFGFDPAAVAWFSLCVYAPAAFDVEIDDVELVKAAGGWRYSPEEEAARLGNPRFSVADFESEPQMHAIGGKLDRVPGTGKTAGTVLRWTQPAAPEGGGFQLVGVPEDIRPYRELRFRARAVSGRPKLVSVCLRSEKGGLDGLLNGVTSEWREIVISLPEMSVVEEFAPEAMLCLEIVAYDAEPFVVEFDDIVLVKGGAGYRYSASERREMGIDTTAPRFRIADFERADSLSLLYSVGGAAEIVPLAKGRNKVPHGLRWQVDGSAPQRFLSILTVPQDIRDYRVLRFRARAEKLGEGQILVYFLCMKGTFGSYLGKLTTRWQDFTVLLPEMTATADFDPEHVVAFGVASYDSTSFTLEIDDVELVKDAGGWKRTESDQIEDVFGAERARKVKASESEHFRVWTDSAAAGKEFPKALEKILSFVAAELGLTEIPGKFPVYIFQNSDLYFDFCVRHGWTRASAEATAGHAARSYFATYYQSPGSYVVAHELTHAIVDRTLGEGGGSWFAEGVASHIEYRWQKKSAAEEFAGRMRSGEIVRLEEFIEIPMLAAESDAKGGPRSAGWLYLQAGAFFEFLLRGPFAKSSREIVAALAVLDEDRADHLKEVERIFGLPLADVERAWLAWGNNPPKRKR